MHGNSEIHGAVIAAVLRTWTSEKKKTPPDQKAISNYFGPAKTPEKRPAEPEQSTMTKYFKTSASHSQDCNSNSNSSGSRWLQGMMSGACEKSDLISLQQVVAALNMCFDTERMCAQREDLASARMEWQLLVAGDSEEFPLLNLLRGCGSGKKWCDKEWLHRRASETH